MRASRAHAAIGAAIFVVHLVAARLLLAGADGRELDVSWNASDPSASVVTASDPSRVEMTIDGRAPVRAAELPPGLHHWQWSERYRGGFVRLVGASTSVGERQSASAPPCSIRLRVGQRALDGGSGSVSELVRALLVRELQGFSSWPVGRFEKLASLTLTWAEGGGEPREVLGATVAAPPDGFIALHAELVFSRATLPVFVGLVPELDGGVLRLRSMASARVIANYRVYRAVLGLLDGDRRATDIAQAELGAALVELLEPPPPLELPGGGRIRIAYCADEPLVFRAGAYGEIPLAVVLENRRGEALPLELPVEPREAPTSLAGAIELDIDINGLGALLHQLWATGFLDDALARADLSSAFNTAPEVESLLSLRASQLELPEPPVIEADHDGFVIGAELGLRLTDGPRVTPARLFVRGRIAVGAEPRQLLDTAFISEAALTCHREPTTLRACYATIARELAARAPDATELITGWLRASFLDLLGDREVTIDGVPGRLQLRAARTGYQHGHLLIHFDSSLVAASANE